MRIYNKDEVNIEKEELKKAILKGAVFIYPTDTIYGLGCDATNKEAVKRLREIKKRYTRPFSVIAPSKNWINDVCECENKKEYEKWLDKLPGPYTLIIQLKNKDCVVGETNNSMDTLGVRIPDHWFTKLINEMGIPIVTTSANLLGDDYMTSIEDLNPEIKKSLDFVVYEGKKHGRPSKLVFLTKKETKVEER